MVHLHASAPPPKFDGVLPGLSCSKLCIGDTIALCVQREKALCFVGSEGFVELGSSLRELDLSRPVPWNHVDCLWVVEQKHQYDAQQALRNFKKAKHRASAAAVETMRLPVNERASQTFASTRTAIKHHTHGGIAHISEMVMATRSQKALEEQRRQRKADDELLAAVKAEKLSNIARNEEKRGTQVTYGETIQLRHLKSRKYLVINPKRRSQSLGCYSVRLDEEGSEDAWLALRPRHSFQFEGSSVHNHDMLTLHSIKRQLWLHVGRTHPSPPPSLPQGPPPLTLGVPSHRATSAARGGASQSHDPFPAPSCRSLSLMAPSTDRRRAPCHSRSPFHPYARSLRVGLGPGQWLHTPAYGPPPRLERRALDRGGRRSERVTDVDPVSDDHLQ